MVAGVGKYYTVEELKRIFQMSHEDTIASNFGKHLEIHEQQTVLSRQYLIDLLGFAPTEPFLTRMQAMKQLGLKSTQMNKLVNRKMLPVFRVKDRRGSSRFFLQRDVDRMKRTLIEYHNSVTLLEDHNHTLSKFLSRIAYYDYKHGQNICRNEDDFKIFNECVVGGNAKETVGEKMKLTTERIRQKVKELSERMDTFFSEIDIEISNEYKAIDEVTRLELKVKEYEKYISELRSNDGKVIPLLEDEALTILLKLKSTPISELGMTNRLLARLNYQLANFDEDGRPALHKNGKWQIDNWGEFSAEYCNLYHLLRFPAKKLHSVSGIGKVCLVELDMIFKELGLRMNDTYYPMGVNATNVMSLIVDRNKFNSKIKTTVYGK